MWYTIFTVVGRGVFPVTMLMHDHCFPRTSADALLLLADRDDDGEYNDGERKIDLTQWHPTRAQQHVTADRWASFGWKVVNVRKAERTAM